MRRGAFAYEPNEAEEALGALADSAKPAADRVWGALTSMVKLEDKVNRQAEAMKDQQQRIEVLTGRVIRLEVQPELLAEDAEDLAAFEERADEPSVSCETLVPDLRKRGRK